MNSRCFQTLKPFCLLKVLGLSLLFIAVSQGRADPLPSDIFGALPMLKNVQLSPDGSKVAALGMQKGRPVLVVTEFGTQKFETVARLKNDFDRLDWLEWANNDRLIFGSSSPLLIQGRAVRVQMLGSMNADGSDFKVLENKALYQKSSFGQASYSYLHALPDEPKTVLLGAYDRRDRAYSIFRTNLYDSTFVKVFGGDADSAMAVPDADGRLLYASKIEDSIATVLYRDSESGPFEELVQLDLNDGQGVFNILGQDPADQKLYVLTNLGRDTTYLAKFNITSKQVDDILMSDPRYDLSGGLFKDGRLVAVQKVTDRAELSYLDADYQAIAQQLAAAFPGEQVFIAGLSDDQTRVLVQTSASNRQPRYFMVDLETGKGSLLGGQYPKLENVRLATTRAFWFKASDGVQVQAQLTQPTDAVTSKSPVIVLPHGGPNARDFVRFDPFVQMFANRGYAVLQVNFRGSSGFGKAYEAAGFKQWGGLMQQDVIDGFKQVVSDSSLNLDADRACVVGASYGGYVALTASFKNADLFQCFVSIAGISDIGSLLQSEFYTRMSETRAMNAARHGDPVVDRALLAGNSAINHLPLITKPVLLIHGTRDTQVKLDQSKKFYKALRKTNKQAKYIEIKNGTHYLDEEKNRKRVFKAMDQFLNQHL